ncbi:hypothetical protein I204_00083 [Kwoniella mangroviensis CBS 8886]|nr:uncharacterized protein I203_02739 [Kwoniella mangroviensis CBS 8507]OCF68080.1 hypothetical protein I203_02739 [Kwoniella mangroviensis CBS 8507]OCF78146.1 hypothetical protein I204_00083 [Kwoniella mangroviensis CBS 8886]
MKFRGSCNFHIKIDLEDTASLILRIRRRAAHKYPDEPLRLNLMSEVATNQALSRAGVAVPFAYPGPKDSFIQD